MNQLNATTDLRRIAPDATAPTTYSLGAGTSDVNGPWIKISGANFIRFAALLGAITATGVGTFGVQYSDDGTNVAATDSLTASYDDTAANKLVLLEIIKPRHPYVRLTLDRGTANSAIAALLLELSGLAKSPAALDAGVHVRKSASASA